jgi:hypothetical protein
MADSDKIITITPNTSVATTHPEIKFVGKDNSPMYLRVLDDNTLSFEGIEGQVFSMSPTMSSGDIFSVNDISGIQSIVVNADGTITLDAQTKSTTIKNNASNTSTLILQNTNADEVDGPILELYRDTVSPADGGDTGTILFTGRDDAGNKTEYGRITMEFDDVSSTSEEGELIFRLTENAGVEQEYFRLRGSSRQIEFNTVADDIDMTWNSDTVSDMMYWNAGSGTNGITIGGGTTTPGAPLHIAGTADNSGGYKAHLRIDDYGTAFDAANSGGAITFGGLQDASNIAYWAKISGEKANTTEDDRSGTLHFWTRKEGATPTQRMMIDEDGRVIVGATSASLTTANHGVIEVCGSTQANFRATDTSGALHTDFAHSANDTWIVNRVAAGKIFIKPGNGDDSIELASNGQVKFNNEYTFPTSDGSANQVLQTDGSGALSFATVSGWDGTSNLTVSDNIKLYFGSTDSYIYATTDSSEHLKIGSDASIWLDADADVVVRYGSTEYARFDGSAGAFTVEGIIQGYKTKMKNVTANTTLTDAMSGQTIYWTSGTLTLPATAEVGQQFVVINNTGGSATPGLGTSNAIATGWVAHAAMDDHSARTYICPAATKWIYIG